MNMILRSALVVAGLAIATQAAAEAVFYNYEGFHGRSFTIGSRVSDFERYGFNHSASSVEVRGERWEACNGARFTGQCVVLRPGRYSSMSAMGLNHGISSARVINSDTYVDQIRHAPTSYASRAYDTRHTGDSRHAGRLYEANVTSVRAVVGTPDQHCWVDREQIPQERSNANIQGAIVGAVIGGILGHQLVKGHRQDIATVGGAVAGAAVGANVAGSSQQAQTRDVRRCENVPNEARPDYWDVTYEFRGLEHRVQMTAPPGPTIRVDYQGEPRV